MDRIEADKNIEYMDELIALYEEHIKALLNNSFDDLKKHGEIRDGFLLKLEAFIHWLNFEADQSFTDLEILKDISLKKLKQIELLGLKLEETAVKKKNDISVRNRSLSKGRAAIKGYGQSCASGMNNGVINTPWVMSLTS